MKSVQEPEFKTSVLTPRQIVAELDKFIIGQQNAKKAVAIALRNRWRRQKVDGVMRDEIVPNNIIMIGPTGVGKTEIARRLAKLTGAPFVKVEATKFTEVGYVGRDVETMIRDLVEIAMQMVKIERRNDVLAPAKLMAENRIVDILMPPVMRRAGSFGFVDSGDVEVEENAETRNKLREQLRKGELDERIIELDVEDSAMPSVNVMGPIGMDDIGINIQEMMGNLFPKKQKKRKLSIAEAKAVLEQEEAEKLIDQEAVAREALWRAENLGIVFIDEIDKIAVTGGSGSGPDVSRSGVQRDLLPIVEGSTVNTKYGTVKTDHVLFIASGAFHVAKPSDLIPELQGRFPIRVELENLTEQDFYNILTVPENALMKQYTALMSSEGVALTFTDASIVEIARTAAFVNQEVVNIGARRLHTIMSTLLEEILFNTPDNMSETAIEITPELVHERLSAIAKNQDLSKYIL
jgi:ATP-dependent HslUV protease ATP-binding subunit HslU